jgi:hypothetical protein
MTERVDELIAHLKRLTDEELRALATTPEWALFMHSMYRLRNGDEWTVERIEMDAQVCREYPCSTEFYRAQAELFRQRFQDSRA